MDTVRSRFGVGVSWIRSYSPHFNTSLLLDTLAVPFTDAHFGSSSTSSGRSASGSEERIVYLDASGRELSQGEVDEFTHSVLSDSPWGFVASRYALTLGLMAVIVNRITHICRPQGRPRPLPLHRRLAIQLPAIFFLAYAGLVLLFVTIHSFFPQHLSIGRTASFLHLPQDVQTLITSSNPSEEEVHLANAALLWRLFLSVCFAVISSTLVRTLEGNNIGLLTHPDDVTNSPTFNLVGFAFLLHLHASSYSFPPNKHVYLSILFQVGEVLGVQICSCWLNRPPISKLALTSFFGIVSTVHFLVALQSGDKGYPFLQTFSRAPDVALMAIIALTLFLHALTSAITDTPLTFSRLIDPRSLPLSTDDYSLALFKVGTACLSSTRLSGMDSDLIDINTSTETWIEVDGAQVSIKGIDGKKIDSSFTADGKGGLAREIRKVKTARSVAMANKSHSDHYFSSPRWREASKFGTMLFKTIQALLAIAGQKMIEWLPFDLPRIPIPIWMQHLPRRIRLLWHGTNGEERRQARLDESRRRAEVQRQRIESDRLFRERAELKNRSMAAISVPAATVASGSADGLRRRQRALSPFEADSFTSTPWQRFFSQEFPEEEDDEWKDNNDEDKREPATEAEASQYWQSLGHGTQLSSDSVGSESEEDDDEDDEEGEEEIVENVVDFSSELLNLARVDFDEEEEEEETTELDSYTSILMAHLSRRQDGPLTRRGYHHLIGGQSHAEQEAQHLINVIGQRRATNSSAASTTVEPSERERMRLCVICYIEDRTIICWPCKCLALCEGCREAMATRPPRSNHRTSPHQAETALTHTCPTCRTPVVGYSRLFLP